MEKQSFYRTNRFTLILSGILLFSLAFFNACEQLDESGDQAGDISADAGANITTQVGSEVMLDASNSDVSEGSLTYQWEFVSKPNGSTAQLSGSNTASPSFTPDVAGDYIIEVTVAAGELSDTDEIIVTANEVANQTKEISGDINSDQTWTDHVEDPDIPDYLITGNLGINAQVTVEPGVLIHVKEDVGIWVNSEGTLISEGQSGNEVIFTSSNEAGNILWKGILFYSSSSLNKLEYTKILYAGYTEWNFSGTNYKTAIGIEGGKLNLMNSTISNSGDYGLFIHSGGLGDFSTNNFSNNANYDIRINADQIGNLDNATTFSDAEKAVEVYQSTLNKSSEITWPALASGARYFVNGNLYIQSYLALAPGALFDFAENKAIVVSSDGTFVADASSGNQIVMTSKDANAGIHWKGLYVSSNDSRNILNNVELSYAGNTEWDFSGTNYTGAIGIENGNLSIVNSNISNSKGYGLYLHSGAFPQFDSNTFDSNMSDAMVIMAEEAAKIDANTSFTNNGWNGVTIYGSTLTTESKWVNLNGDAMYRIAGWIYTEAGLTINAGAEFAFDENNALIVKSTGYLIAQGASGNPVVFTSSDEAGQINWAGIWIRSSNSQNELDFVEINYAGGYEFDYSGTNYATAIAGDDADSPTLSLTNSVIKNSASYAVYWEAGTINDVTASAANNTFQNNGESPDVVIP